MEPRVAMFIVFVILLQKDVQVKIFHSLRANFCNLNDDTERKSVQQNSHLEECFSLRPFLMLSKIGIETYFSAEKIQFAFLMFPKIIPNGHSPFF